VDEARRDQTARFPGVPRVLLRDWAPNVDELAHVLFASATGKHECVPVKPVDPRGDAVMAAHRRE
jgi:hypothetical protein